jgi:hypothetical protein
MRYYVDVQFFRDGKWVNYTFADDATITFNRQSAVIKQNGKILFTGNWFDDGEYANDEKTPADEEKKGVQSMIVANDMSENLLALYPEARGIQKAKIIMEYKAWDLIEELRTAGDAAYFSLVEMKNEDKERPSNIPDVNSSNNWMIWLALAAVAGTAIYVSQDKKKGGRNAS